MKTLRSKKAIRFIYILYGIIVAFVFLYLRFPSVAFCEYFQSEFGRIFPNHRLSIGNISPALPFGLKFKSLQISNRQGSQWRIDIDRFSFMPEILSYLQGKSGCRLDAQMYEGDLKGEIGFPEGVKGGPYTAELEIKDLNLGTDSVLTNITGYNMAGRLAGNLRAGAKDAFLNDDNIDGVFDISDGYFSLPGPFLGMNSVFFTSLRIKMSLNKTRLNLAGLELRSEEMFVNASGTLLLNEKFSLSNLDIKGSIEPYADLLKSITSSATKGSLREKLKEGKIPFIIHGTVLNPGIRFI
ncbi:MAG: type II secretion system protein GspN [Deltaproteobacteria bacterium]|nr:type II secretion system protein GspN [Deltaproteobacteria bacterium]